MNHYFSLKSFKQTGLKNLTNRNGGEKYLRYKCYMLWVRVHENVASLCIVNMSTRGSHCNCINIDHRDPEKDH